MSHQHLPQELGLSLSSQEFLGCAETKNPWLDLDFCGWEWTPLRQDCRVGLWCCPALTVACRAGGEEQAENRAQLDSQVEKLSVFVR